MIQYIIESSICWTVFFGIYWCFLKQETFFEINRGYLISSILLGLLIPSTRFININQITQESSAIDQYIYVVATQKEAVVSAVQTNITTSISDYLVYGLLAIYLMGICFFGIRFIVGLYRIARLYALGFKTQKKDHTLVQTPQLHLPFSFFNLVFISEQLPLKEDVDKILKHELFHVRRWHSIDVMFLEITHILFWFNPVLKLYKRALKQTHEYLADKEVIKGSTPKLYGELLMRQSNSGLEIALANHFFQSHLKKRITMMYKQKSRSPELLRYLLVIPFLVFAVILFSSSINKNDNSLSESTEMVEGDLEKEFRKVLAQKELLGGESCGMELFKEYQIALDNGNTVFKKIFKNYCLQNGIKTVSKEGVIVSFLGENISILEKFDSIPPPPPSRTFTKNIDSSDPDFVAPPNAPSAPPAPPALPESIVVDEMPRFPGCENQGLTEAELKTCSQTKLIEYIFKNIEYPAIARKNNIQGQIVLQFAVTSEGFIENINILREIGGGCGEAAKSTVATMNNMSERWIPGKKDGVAVKSMFTLPVRFKLQEGDKQKSISNKTLSYNSESNSQDKEKIYTVVDEKPLFPGCEGSNMTKAELEKCSQDKMLKYIYSNLKYPEEAKSEGIDGQVVIQFIIEKTGAISDVTVVREIGGDCGESAKAVVQSMPQWTPGKQKGEAVNVQYTLPVRFKLQGNKEETSSTFPVQTRETPSKEIPGSNLKKELVLHQNAPNPFNGETKVTFEIEKRSNVKLTFKDVNGKVLKIIDGNYPGGQNSINITSKDLNNYTGVVFYQLAVEGKKSEIKKMIRAETGRSQ